MPKENPNVGVVFARILRQDVAIIRYLGIVVYLGQIAVQIQSRARIQLGMSCDAAGGTGRHRPVDSLFGPRPNYAVPCGLYSPPGRKLSWLLAALLFAASSAAQARIINAASPSLADVTRAIAPAVDGDTVIVPAGTAAWTSGLTITKGITLVGQTTTDPVNKTANDRTIITDNVARGAGGRPIIRVQSAPGRSYRVSGITFAPGSVTELNPNGAVKLTGDSQAVRVDHCHFNNLAYQASMIKVAGAVYGVIDHNIMLFNAGNNQSVIIFNGGTSNVYGDDAWAAPANYGGSNFIFLEDNCFNNITNPNREFAGATDDFDGGRWVFRYNHCYDVEVQTHGTECCRDRGGRAREVYNNDFHFTSFKPFGGIRAGGLITHDNTFFGVQSKGIGLDTYRGFFKFPGGPWGGASGDNVWDANDTEGNGTQVEGHPPFLYESGTVSSGTTTTLTDTTKNWTANQWAGFIAKRVSDNGIMFIISNTNNTLTGMYYTDSGGGVVWPTGNQYQIHKVLIALDQPCRGQGDLITGDPNPINTVFGVARWPRQASEPTYSWNDIYVPTGAHVNIYIPDNPRPALIVAGRDFFNNTPMPGYTPYVYPHPLVTGQPPPPPTASATLSATPSSPHNLHKKWKKQAKELKGKKGKKAKQNSTNEMPEGQNNLGE
jgi:hypothetical protein